MLFNEKNHPKFWVVNFYYHYLKISFIVSKFSSKLPEYVYELVVSSSSILLKIFFHYCPPTYLIVPS